MTRLAPVFFLLAPLCFGDAYFEVSYPQGKDPRTFIIRLSDPAQIQKARDIVAGRDAAVHVLGKVVKAPAFYNSAWSFHLDPGSIRFFEMAVEVCDATVESVEEHLAEVGGALLPNNVFCSWASAVAKEAPVPSDEDQHITNVSAASYSGVALAPGSIASAFGTALAAEAGSDGVSIKVTDSEGTQRDAELYYASPHQVNYVVPENLASGVATVTLTTDAGRAVTEQVYLQPAAPALFAAGWIFRVRANGTTSYEPITEPIDMGAETDEVYLSLLGTGLRGHPGLEFVHTSMLPGTVIYAGPQPELPGVDQINIKLSPEARGLGETSAGVSLEYPDRYLESNTVPLEFR